ncbi:hypothetical protein Tco_1115788, partial [Tanacetum coccineum]
MATNPNDVRLTVLMALQEARDEESCLEEQMLSLMRRFADTFTNRRPEINRLMTLPNHPLIDYGHYALERMTGADMRNASDRYRYIKNHKKTAKNEQTWTRETEEHKRSQRFKAKAKESQLS